MDIIEYVFVWTCLVTTKLKPMFLNTRFFNGLTCDEQDYNCILILPIKNKTVIDLIIKTHYCEKFKKMLTNFKK